MKNALINAVLGVALKDIHSLIAFFGKLESKLEAFAAAEEAKAAEIEKEITHLASEKAQVLANVDIAKNLQASVSTLTKSA